jgi:hypothetical protein
VKGTIQASIFVSSLLLFSSCLQPPSFSHLLLRWLELSLLLLSFVQFCCISFNLPHPILLSVSPLDEWVGSSAQAGRLSHREEIKGGGNREDFQ